MPNTEENIKVLFTITGKMFLATTKMPYNVFFHVRFFSWFNDT